MCLFITHRLNEQLEPILKLLKDTEKINLAPEILDPEPRGIQHRIVEATNRLGHGTKHTIGNEQWVTSKMYVIIIIHTTQWGQVHL